MCNNVIISYFAKVCILKFSPKGQRIYCSVFLQFFIFFDKVFTTFFPKSFPGVDFFPKVSNHKRSLISPYELLLKS